MCFAVCGAFCSAIGGRFLDSGCLATSLREREDEEDSFKSKQDNSQSRRARIDIQFDARGREGGWQGTRGEICANGWSNAEADREGYPDVGKCLGTRFWRCDV